ncbi:hypothetical protein LIER_34493 [Lithospermum erythrorhizon]|uniref:Uncharacterized protein n=1 Tax=Lithospermum erythrorhizon TaxID=34254 RepID=A0AAV3S2P3_LITER
MGQWNRRYRVGGGRKKHYNYQQPPPSPPRTQPLPYGRSENGVPSWEIDFCYLSGVTWHKISTAKKFMLCHDSVMKWNDVGGEEAFRNAKRRYWEKINGLPCKDSSPDPEMYIGKVDWDSYIDPELMLDIDQAYFNPDDEGRSEKFYNNSKEDSSYSLARNDKNFHEEENPWDSNIVQGTSELKSCIDPWEQYAADDKNTDKGQNTWESNPVQGTGEVKSLIDPWEQYCTEKMCINNREDPWESNAVQGAEKLKSNVDPWERHCVEVDRSINKNAWRDSKDKSSLWNRGQSQNMLNSPHIRGTQLQLCADYAQTKGRGYVGYNSWSSNQKGKDFPVNASSNDRPWRDCWNNSERKFSEYANDDSRRSGFRGQNRGGRERYDGCRKREGPMQHESRNKNFKSQANDYGTSYRWRN